MPFREGLVGVEGLIGGVDGRALVGGGPGLASIWKEASRERGGRGGEVFPLGSKGVMRAEAGGVMIPSLRLGERSLFILPPSGAVMTIIGT